MNLNENYPKSLLQKKVTAFSICHVGQLDKADRITQSNLSCF